MIFFFKLLSDVGILSLSFYQIVDNTPSMSYKKRSKNLARLDFIFTECRYHVSDKCSRTHKQIISQTWHYSDVTVWNSFGFEHFHILYTKYSIQHI